MSSRCGVAAGLLGALLTAVPAPGEEPPGGVRLTLAGEIDAAYPLDENSSFNDDDYRRSGVERLRLRLTTALELGEHVSLLGELRSDDFQQPRVYALFLRLRPWRARAIDLQAGLIPPVFGAATRRSYALDNTLIGAPLAFGYLTALRDDALPASEAELYAARGGGSYVFLSGAEPPWRSGLPLVDARRRDFGAELRLGERPLQLAVSLTRGSPSKPRVEDDNDALTLAGRLAWRPQPGLELAASAARGGYLAETALTGRGDAGDFPQTALGGDLEWSRGYWLLRGELVWSRWESPPWRSGDGARRLDAWGVTAEARYKILPGLYAAARYDRLGFSELTPGSGTGWDAPVSRVEAGGGWSPHRRLLLKLAWQQNWRDGGAPRRDGMLLSQAVLWF